MFPATTLWDTYSPTSFNNVASESSAIQNPVSFSRLSSSFKEGIFPFLSDE